MKAHMKITDPDRIEVTLTVTMPLKTWKELREQLSKDHPSWEFGSKITDMVYQINEHFTPKEVE